MGDLEREIVIGGWFRPFGAGGCSTSNLVQSLRNGDREAIAAAIGNLVAGGLLVPGEVSQTDGETVYSPTEKLWIERERALHDLRWRKPALLNQEDYRAEDLILALLMAPHIFNAGISGPFLPESTRRYCAEISIYLYKINSESVETAWRNLIGRRLVREGNEEFNGKLLPSLELTADGVVAYPSVAATLGLSEGQSILDLDRRTEIVVFLIWQGDYPTSRDKIESALRGLVERLNKEKRAPYPLRIDEAVVVGDGAVRIDQNLLDRILVADAVVADVTPVYRAFGRLTPNPNVLLEVGYALASRKPQEVFLVEEKRNAAGIPGDGNPATQLPFDIVTVHRSRFSGTEEIGGQLAAEFDVFLARRGWRASSETPANVALNPTRVGAPSS
jgi:nucleoside 2-deoxyribosyltransferase